MRDKIENDLGRSRAARAAQYLEDEVGKLLPLSLNAAHEANPFECKKPLYHCLLPKPLLQNLCLSAVGLVGANLQPHDGQELDGDLFFDVGLGHEHKQMRLRIPTGAALLGQARETMPRPFILAVALDLVTRLLERGAEALACDGTDADRGRWYRELKLAGDQASLACKRHGKEGWEASWLVARHLAVDVIPRPLLVRCMAGIVVDFGELAYEV
jgi:hypothetical protein